MMNELLETQAKIIAEELLLQGKSDSQAARLLMRQQDPKPDQPGWPGMSKAHALAVIEAVKREWVEAAAPAREELRAVQRRRLLHLYNASFTAKRYTVCVQVERLLAELDGTMAPKKVDLRMPGSSDADAEFEDRSIVELNYYAETGRWPDEGAVH